MTLLPIGGFPAGTRKAQLEMGVSKCLHRQTGFVPLHANKYTRPSDLAQLWAKAAKAGRFLPALKLPGFRA